MTRSHLPYDVLTRATEAARAEAVLWYGVNNKVTRSALAAADVAYVHAQYDLLTELADFFMERDGPGYVTDELCRRREALAPFVNGARSAAE